jgi:hypothetical protein
MPGTDRLKSALADRYKIEREIGSGGMATVYLARDIKHDRDVALKVLRSDLSAVIGTERFLAEVRITAKLDHPHILTLIDSGEADGILFYVLPYVRGESLRSKIQREKQLGIDEALSITKQVASALDYAHSHGVVHRDIKPENILLHEGEAVLADFGIALAVKEAGGNRLTETGLSLGTPQYMSPEQATGDRQLDKRSDIYSLAAVFYEMISGEPPVTGATAQVMIAKLLTERPVKLRVVRDTVTPEMELATEKALAKVPADRFSSAGEFVRAMSVAAPRQAGYSSKSRRKWVIAAGVALVVLAAAAIYSKSRPSDQTPASRVALRERIQITNTGGVSRPTISDDGKTLAYVVTVCGAQGCRYGVDVRDVAGGPTRRLIDDATAVYRLEISPDRRNVLILGSIDGTFGSFVVSMFGGKPRRVINGYATFYAGGDSLLLARLAPPAESFWMLVSGVDGVVSDSVSFNVPSDRVPFFGSIPGTNRIAYSARREALDVGIAERNGKIISSFKLPPGIDGAASTTIDALWLYLDPPATDQNYIVRLPFDATGKLAAKGDTVYSGRPTGMSLTSDGGTIVFDEGASDYSVWAMPLDDVVKNRFSDDKRITRSTGVVRGSISPDGKLIAIGRDHPSGLRQYAVTPFGSTTEIPIPGRHSGIAPLDSATLKVFDPFDSGVEFSLLDYRRGIRSAVRRIPDVDFRDNTRLGADTWAWIPSSGRSIMLQRDNEARPREIKLPPWYKDTYWVAGSTDGRSLVFTGWQAPTEDSLGVGLFSMPDGRFTQIFTGFGESVRAFPLDDGSVLVSVNDTPESVTLYRVRPGSSPERIGSTQRLIAPGVSLTVSSDMKRAFVITLDDRRDVWMSKVVK